MDVERELLRRTVRRLLARAGGAVLTGLALAGHGQWGLAWSPLEEEEPGELSWAEFEAELHALLDAVDGAARGGGVDEGGRRPGSGPVP